MTTTTGAVPWRLVGTFYGIAFGGAVLLSAGLLLAGADFTAAQVPVVYALVIGILYMPLPLIAGLVTDRVAGRRVRPELRRRVRWRGIGRVVLVGATAIVALALTGYGVVYVLGNLAGIPGVGRVVTTQQGFIDQILAIAPPGVAVDPGAVPPLANAYVIMLVAGLGAGFTINALFAFGEEYGWRGVLADLLAPLGPLRANVLIGVLWGLWHAPVILLGYNYGQYRFVGVLLMCAWTVPLSFVLARARQWSGSVVAPAIIHGGVNATAGFAVVLLAGADPRLSLPAGLAAALATALVAAACWALFRTGSAAVTPASPPAACAADLAVTGVEDDGHPRRRQPPAALPPDVS